MVKCINFSISYLSGFDKYVTVVYKWEVFLNTAGVRNRWRRGRKTLTTSTRISLLASFHTAAIAISWQTPSNWNCSCFLSSPVRLSDGKQTWTDRHARTHKQIAIFWHSSWKHSAPKTDTRSRSGSREFIGLLSGSLSKVPVGPFPSVTHSEGVSEGAVQNDLLAHSILYLQYFHSYGTHWRLASPQLSGDLITIKFTIFQPISGLQTLIKAMHSFETRLLSQILYKIYIFFLLKKKQKNIDIISYAISLSSGTVWSYQPAFGGEGLPLVRCSVRSRLAGLTTRFAFPTVH